MPAGIVGADEPVHDAALRELEEETGHVLAPGAELQPLGRFYALPSETNKYVHFYVATPVVWSGAAKGDTEIEKYFDMSIIEMPFEDALKGCLRRDQRPGDRRGPVARPGRDVTGPAVHSVSVAAVITNAARPR